MNFDDIILKNQMPIITLSNSAIEYNYKWFNYNITVPFDEEIYNKIQEVPYTIYLPEEEKILTVTYQVGIEIEQSAYETPYMTIWGVEGTVQDLGVLSVSKNNLNYLTVTDDPVPYSFNPNYEEEFLSDEDILRPLNNKEEDKQEWSISWDTGKESQDNIIGW